MYIALYVEYIYMVTLNDIAREAGVSRGTVDRALNNRGRIQPQVAERIRNIAAEMGYIPNANARALALSGHHIKVGVILQFAETLFIQEVLRGIMSPVKDSTRYGIELKLERISGLNTDKAIAFMNHFREDKIDAIILVGSNDPALRREIDTCKKAGISVITLNSDVPNSHRRCFIGQNAFRSGQTAASEMADLMGRHGSILVFYGLDSTIHSERIRGFRDVISRECKEIRIIDEKKTENDPRNLYMLAKASLDKNPDIDGIYLCGEGAGELCRLLQERNMASDVRLVLHDLIGCPSNYIMDRTVNYVIDDDGFGQGFYALFLLHLWRNYRIEPENEYYYTDIRIINSNNYSILSKYELFRQYRAI